MVVEIKELTCDGCYRPGVILRSEAHMAGYMEAAGWLSYSDDSTGEVYDFCPDCLEKGADAV